MRKSRSKVRKSRSKVRKSRSKVRKSRSKVRKSRSKSLRSVRQRMQNEEEIARQALSELGDGVRRLTSRSNIELICPYCGLSWSRTPGMPIPNVFKNHVSSEQRVSNAGIVVINPARHTYLCQVCGTQLGSLSHATMHITRCPNRIF